jgi:hypothetical protein
MENRECRNRVHKNLLSESSGNSRAREVNIAIQKIPDDSARSKLCERTPELALSLAQSEAFIPWVLRVVDSAFSRALQGEAEPNSNQSGR